MRHLLVFILSVFLSHQICAQTYYGNVVDSLNKPVAFANVIAQQADSALIVGTVTDEKGDFILKLKNADSFDLTISFVGYITWHKKIAPAKSANLGTIVLSEEKTQLEGIEILAKRPSIHKEVDRLVFEVRNSIASVGGDAIDVLKKTPGVRIQQDEVEIIGRKGVRVLVNGRMSPLTGEDLSNYLHTLTSDNITKIEVITNPPAKYEAEGNSGLINIVLKKAKIDYFSGLVRSTYQKSTYSTFNLGGDLTYQKNKWATFFNIEGSDGSIHADEDNEIMFPDQNWNTETDIRYYRKQISGRAGADYDLSNHITFGVQYMGAVSRPDDGENTETKVLASDQTIDSLLQTKAYSDNDNYYHDFNGHFIANLDSSGRKVAIDLDYLVYSTDLNRTFTTRTLIENADPINSETFQNVSHLDLESFTSRVDVEWPTGFAALGFGGKLSFIKNRSDLSAYKMIRHVMVEDEAQSNIFEYNENTEALYTSASKSINKWDFKLGLRIEFTQTEGNSLTLSKVNENNYYKLFPTAYVTFNANDVHSFSFDYGKRISRPGYSKLNPFRWYSNPYSYTEGNPFLQPSFVDNFELSHLYKDNLSTALYISLTDDGSDQITLANSDNNIQATVMRNFLQEYSIGWSQSHTFGFKWIETYWQYDLNYTKIKSDLANTRAEQEGFNFYLELDNSFYLNANHTLLGELNFWYSAPGVSGIDKITESYAADIAFKSLCLNKDLQLALVVTDIFKTDRRTINSVVNGLSQKYNNYYDNRRLKFSASYRFGNRKLKNTQKRLSNEEERNRL
ncbi:outer membrane beta-barrel family protein [Fulvivirga sediminis]|uniref:TonB-dependent receptor n=1 Tax=Fulvivirga sediminis TaxID=2803949 RepID=A0A937FDJ5_9BACT|nr:outer membrane beta-barrel family protein [Fulvivirga sediminis]MBL3658443.1 TonB-dependent receptor [Fulvivirga sediminis]